MKIQPDEPCPCGSGELFKDCHGPKVEKSNTPDIESRTKLKVIPEPDPSTRSVFKKTGKGTVIFQGRATSVAQCCGECGAPLIVGLRSGQVRGIVLECNECGSFNDTH